MSDNHASMMPNSPENFVPASAEALTALESQVHQLQSNAEVLAGTTLNNFRIAYDGICASFATVDSRSHQTRDEVSIYSDLDGDLTIATVQHRPTMEDDGPVGSVTRTARTYPLHPSKPVLYAQEIGRPNAEGNLEEVFTSIEKQGTPMTDKNVTALSETMASVQEAVVPKASHRTHRTWFNLGSLLRRRLQG